MSKSFWEGFRDGYLSATKYLLPFAIAFIMGVWAERYLGTPACDQTEIVQGE